MYEIERGGRKTLQHEGRIKMYYASEDPKRGKNRAEPQSNEEVPTREEPVVRIEEQPAQEPDILDELPLLNVPRVRIEPEEEAEKK